MKGLTPLSSRPRQFQGNRLTRRSQICLPPSGIVLLRSATPCAASARCADRHCTRSSHASGRVCSSRISGAHAKTDGEERVIDPQISSERGAEGRQRHRFWSKNEGQRETRYPLRNQQTDLRRRDRAHPGAPVPPESGRRVDALELICVLARKPDVARAVERCGLEVAPPAHGNDLGAA